MPLDDEFKMLERSAIMLEARQPFIDWLAATFPGDEPVAPEPEAYLITSLDTQQEVEGWLRRHFNELFEEQLFAWYTDETGWPGRRTYKMFLEWFDVKLIPTVWDTEKGFIEKV